MHERLPIIKLELYLHDATPLNLLSKTTVIITLRVKSIYAHA